MRQGSWMLVIGAVLIAVGFAPTVQAQVNGCGSGWNRYLVPNEIKPLGCNFETACNRHDECYGRCAIQQGIQREPQCEYLDCATDGPLEGTEACESVRFRQLRLAANERRTQCDARFMLDLDKTNAEKPRCLFWTALYPFAVRVFGGKAFLGADASAANVSPADRKAYALAVNQMLEMWSDAQIAAYTQRLLNGDLEVDLTRRIVFDRKIGFRNP